MSPTDKKVLLTGHTETTQKAKQPPDSSAFQDPGPSENQSSLSTICPATVLRTPSATHKKTGPPLSVVATLSVEARVV